MPAPRYALLAGDPSSGWRLLGPFPDRSTALSVGVDNPVDQIHPLPILPNNGWEGADLAILVGNPITGYTVTGCFIEETVDEAEAAVPGDTWVMQMEAA